SPASGRVAEILVEVDQTVSVGTVLARIATGEEIEPGGNGHRPRRYSPVVQRIAAEHGVDLDQVQGTGRGGRVRKQDVLAFVEDGGGAAAPAEPPMHIESPYRPEPVAPRAEPVAAPRPEPAAAPRPEPA